MNSKGPLVMGYDITRTLSKKKKGNLITVEYPSNQNSEGKIKAVRARGAGGGGG